MLNGDPALNDLDSSGLLIVLEVVNKVVDMSAMSMLLTTISLIDVFTSCD